MQTGPGKCGCPLAVGNEMSKSSAQKFILNYRDIKSEPKSSCVVRKKLVIICSFKI
jgi:hypothetical protein